MTGSDFGEGNAHDVTSEGVDPVVVAEEWDEGLAPQRTQLAWGRTGLAVAVATAVLARRAWAVGGAFGVAALVLVGFGGVVWLVGMRESRDRHLHREPRGLVGARGFGLISAGTLLLAIGAAMLGILLHP